MPKTAGQLLHQFRNVQDSLEDKLNLKVEKEYFNKNAQQNWEKFKIINEQIEEKANKD